MSPFRRPNGKKGVFYNFEERPDPGIDELSGVSVFYKDEDGTIYHTYSSYGRGGEMYLPFMAGLMSCLAAATKPSRATSPIGCGVTTAMRTMGGPRGDWRPAGAEYERRLQIDSSEPLCHVVLQFDKPAGDYLPHRAVDGLGLNKLDAECERTRLNLRFPAGRRAA